MQKDIIDNGRIHGHVAGMGFGVNYGLQIDSMQQRNEVVYNSDSIWGRILSNIFPLFRQVRIGRHQSPEKALKEMITGKITLVVLGCFGISAYVYTCICILLNHFGINLGDIDLGKVNNPAKSLIIATGIVWMVVSIWQKYQNGRKVKIENDEREHALKIEKQKHAALLHVKKHS